MRRSRLVRCIAKTLTVVLAWTVTLVMLVTGTARAEIIYSTGFEAPTFTAGQAIAGQDAWTSRFGSAAGTVSPSNPAAGLQDLEFRARDLPLFGFGFNLESVRRFLNFDTSGTGARRVNVAVDVRLNGPSLQGDLVEAIFSAIDLGFQDYGQMQISADGHLYIYGSQFADVFVGSVTLDTYHRLAMSIDFVGRETTFYLDGADLVAFAFDSSLQSTIFSAASLHMAAPTDPSRADPAQYAAYFDNLRIEAIPEPPTLAILVLSLAGLGLSRRKQAESRLTAATDARVGPA